MSDLAGVREDFIRMTNRYDLIVSGDISTNTDNGANAFINAGLRYLDSKVRHKKSVKKFVKVLAIGDFTFTVPDYLSLEQLLMITATEEIDLTKGELSVRDFRKTYGRPYSEWVNGAPIAWAVNQDILVEEMESSVPQDALSQDDVRRVPSEGEILSNFTFDEEFYTLVGHTESDSNITNDTPNWQRDNSSKIQYNPTNNSMDIDGSFISGDTIFKQNIADMRVYPDLGISYIITIIISNYVSGDLSFGLGDVTAGSITANGTYTIVLVPTTYSSEANFRVISRLATDVDCEIDSCSISEVGLISSTKTLPIPVENRTGIIFNPPTDVARTVEMYARFYTPPMTRDTDRNFWTDFHPTLLAMAAAYNLEKRNQSVARLKYWLEAMSEDIFTIEADLIEDEMNAMEIAHERTR